MKVNAQSNSLMLSGSLLRDPENAVFLKKKKPENHIEGNKTRRMLEILLH